MALKWLGRLLFFLLVAACFAPAVVPPFLDRIYYRGPLSDHFDGARFFNPDGPVPYNRRTGSVVGRMLSDDARSLWPTVIPVTPTVPPARVTGDEMRVTWIGHATVLIQTAGLNILTDPIWSDRASPVSFTGPRRVRAPGVRFDDLPRIDLVLVSHNHYDHLDLPTLRRLWTRDRPTIVTSLGNDTILRRAGIESRVGDWGARIALRGGAEVVIQRNHHWGSRWFTDRNRALWSAFTVRTSAGNIFFAGDTGWGNGSWVREVAREGPFRLAIIPVGAYAPRDVMAHNHVDPAEALRVFEMLDPVMALGMHWGTFQLTFEPIDEPRQRLAALTGPRGLAGRFVATEVGRPFAVPPALDRARQ